MLHHGDNKIETETSYKSGFGWNTIVKHWTRMIKYHVYFTCSHDKRAQIEPNCEPLPSFLLVNLSISSGCSCSHCFLCTRYIDCCFFLWGREPIQEICINVIEKPVCIWYQGKNNGYYRYKNITQMFILYCINSNMYEYMK